MLPLDTLVIILFFHFLNLVSFRCFFIFYLFNYFPVVILSFYYSLSTLFLDYCQTNF